MTRLASALGEKYQAKRKEIFTRKFELGGHTFTVRIPYVSESDAIFERVMNPDEAHIQRLYEAMAAPMLEFKDQANEDVVYEDSDILVKGRSMREAARNKAMTENRITEYIKLLVPEAPDATMDDITYADIEAEFPMSVQLALVEKIAEVISPTYKESRGN